ncbi:MAG: S8 family serine peptidase [Bacteroidota bacterium]
MKQRIANTILSVRVKNHKGNFLEKANVALVKPRSDEVIDLSYQKKSKRYITPKLEKGDEYILRVSSRGYYTDRRAIRIMDGRNQEVFVLGTKDMPYYHRGRVKVPFLPIDKIAVKIQVNRDSQEYSDFQQACGKLHLSASKTALRCLEDGQVLLLDLPDELEEAELEKILLRLEEHPAISNAGRVIRENDQFLTYVSKFLVVRFGPQVTDPKARSIMSEFSIKPARKIPYVPNGWLASTDLPASLGFLHLINKLNGLDEVAYAEPSLVMSVTDLAITPNDYLVPEQWHVPLVNLPDAWQTLQNENATGVLPGMPDDLTYGSKDLVISIFDQGIQSETDSSTSVVSATHPDFMGNLADGNPKVSEFYNFKSMVPNNDGITNNHGMGCSGVATGLVGNSSGVTGVDEGAVGAAPNCRLMSIIRPQSEPEYRYTDAFIWMAGFQPGWRDDVGTYTLGTTFPAVPAQAADIISCSFTWDAEPISGLVSDTLDYITIYGRGGRGTAIFWASGNYSFSHPITGEPIDIVTAAALHPKVMAVGASTKDTDGTTEVRAFYSAIALNDTERDLEFVAPSSTQYDPPNHDPYRETITNDPDAQFGIISSDFSEAGNLPGNPANSTSLLGVTSSSGLSTLTVSSTSGFSVSPVPHIIFIGNPGAIHTEVREIKSIDTSLSTITVESLDFTHPNGTTIVAGGVPAYQNTFGGTSAAAPLAAGIAALCLSINPALSWIELRHILRITAEKIDHSNGSLSGAWTGGGAFQDYSRWYGWGRLDANAAVTAALNYTHEIDLVVRDNLGDLGGIPSGGWHAQSPDIWVKQTDSPIPTTLAYGDPPPHENPKRGQDNYLFIRVKNVGSADSHEFWIRGMIAHYPGFEFRYPEEWRPSNLPGEGIPNPLKTGSYLIGESRIDGLAAGDDLIVKMTWDEDLVPPETVVEAGMTVHWHPCLLAEISPHDGLLPSGTTFAVKDYNNLAHRNISINPADPASSTVAAAIVAGTSDPTGIQGIVIDRSLLPADYRVFIRAADEKVMNQWITAVERDLVTEAEPLDLHSSHDHSRPNDDSVDKYLREKEANCEVIILEDTRLQIKCGDDKSLLIHAPANTRLSTIFHKNPPKRPRMTRGKVEGQEVIFFDGGVESIEMPTTVDGETYMPLVFGLERPAHRRGNGTLLINQRLANGELSTGYTIQG